MVQLARDTWWPTFAVLGATLVIGTIISWGWVKTCRVSINVGMNIDKYNYHIFLLWGLYQGFQPPMPTGLRYSCYLIPVVMRNEALWMIGDGPVQVLSWEQNACLHMSFPYLGSRSKSQGGHCYRQETLGFVSCLWLHKTVFCPLGDSS